MTANRIPHPIGPGAAPRPRSNVLGPVRLLKPTNFRTGMFELRQLREIERWIAWARLLAVPFALLEVGLFTPAYPPGYERWAWAATAVLAIGATLLFALARMERALAAQIRLGLLALAFDAAIVSAFVFVYAFEAGMPTNHVLDVVVIEAALRFGITGGIGLAVALVPVLALAEVWRSSRFAPDAFNVDHVTLPVIVMVLIGLLVGWLVERLSQRASALSRLVGVNRAVLEANRDGIVVTSPDGRGMIVNAAARRLGVLHGISNEASVSEALAAVAPLTTDPERYAALAGTIAADPEHEGLDEYELAASGQAFERFTAPVRDSSGTLIGRLFVVRDITAERVAARAKTELLNTVSHELRTPLTSILGFAELLARKDADAETARRYGQTIEAEAGRLARIVDHLLDLQQLEPGALGEWLDLRTVLDQEVERFRREAPERRIALEVPGEPLHVRGDRERLVQVIANLVSNALKHSPPARPVEIAAFETDQGFVRTTVRDSGAGIPAAVQPNVFQAFFRADSTDTRTSYGLGLGLALSRQLIVAHGGEMGFESREGEGSTFWFDLPAQH